MEKIAQEDRLQILKASQAKLKVRDDDHRKETPFTNSQFNIIRSITG